MTDPLPSPMPPVKTDAQRSEFWISIIGTVGSLLSATMSKTPGASTWINFGALITTITAYVVMRTPITAESGPGWKSKAFWAALPVLLVSIAVGITDAPIPGLPDGVTKVASAIAIALTSAGYTALRYQAKNAPSTPPPGPPATV